MNSGQLFRKKTVLSIIKQKDEEAHKLNQSLSVYDLTFFGIAAIVGAGIFSTVGTAVVQGGPAVSLLFLFTAFSCGLSALCYAQFASAVPVAGSAYTYAYVSFGELIAWIVGWDLFMEYAISNIAVAISWSDYFKSLMLGFGVVVPTHFQINGSNIRVDIPAFAINMLLTILCYIGIKESKNANNILVVIKMLVIVAVLSVGVFYIHPDNWVPFAPHGVTGVLYGISSIVFAYIGFDAISTTSEECVNPQRDLPKAMLWSLGISTVIYILITLVLTGMVHYSKLGVGDPLAFVFEQNGLSKFSGFISLFSVITLSSAMLVYQLGMPRIWMSMSRDGLLPKAFSLIHPRFKTPGFSTIVMGLAVGIPALFADLKGVVDLTSIGTLFAFALVCGGLVFQEIKGVETHAKFKITYISSRYILPLFIVAFMIYQLQGAHFNASLFSIDYLPITVFYILGGILSFMAINKKLSLIPVLGFLSNLYLMAELGATNWIRFVIWLVLGLIVYFFYGMKNSRLRAEEASIKI